MWALRPDPGRVRTNLVNILKRQGLARKGAGTPVTLRWSQWTAGFSTDPVSGRRVGTATPQSEVVNAFVHFVGGSAVIRQNAEGRDGLTYEIAGVKYGEKKVNGVLTATWDAMVQGQKLGRTLLLQLAT